MGYLRVWLGSVGRVKYVDFIELHISFKVSGENKMFMTSYLDDTCPYALYHLVLASHLSFIYVQWCTCNSQNNTD